MEPNWMMQRAHITPHKSGLTYNGQMWTFGQLNELSVNIAKQLTTLHIKKHDRIAILAPSNAELVLMIYGCMQLQLEIVLLNSRLSKQELQYQIDDAEVSAILLADVFSSHIHDARVRLFSTIQQQAYSEVELATEWDEKQTTSIMYTSGTTGFPKGVRQTLGNHKMSAIASAFNLGISPDDTWLCCMPLFHISGFSILMRSLLYGMEVRLYEKFDAASCAEDIANGRVTKMSAVNVMLERLLTHMEQQHYMAHPRFSTMLAGGGPIPTQFLHRAQALHMNVAQTYGMTETASQTATLSIEDAFRKAGSAGKSLFFYEMKIDGANKPGEHGEICIKGPHVTPGYIGRFEHLQSMQAGWLHTGDIGYLDDEGYLYVLDRRSDLIISGGENIYPAEIENALLAHPAVAEAGVCGMDDATWGQVPAAFVVLKQQVTVEELLEFCKERLASYKLPKSIHVVDALPRNGANKLVRRQLLQLL